MSITVAHIVAMAENRVIGVDNTLPWRLSADLKHFKALTMARPIVMGRKTWESIGRPLPGRSNIVVSSQATFQAPGAQVFGDVESALAEAKAIAARDGVDEVFVIGGETLYRQSQSLVTRVYLTEVALTVDGDAYYPPLDTHWQEVARECYPADGEQPAFAFVRLERR